MMRANCCAATNTDVTHRHHGSAPAANRHPSILKSAGPAAASAPPSEHADDRGCALSARDSTEHRQYHPPVRSEEHTSELQSLMRNSYAVFCLKKKTTPISKHRKQ